MRSRRFFFLIVISFFFISCWKFENNHNDHNPLTPAKVLGYIPIYGSDSFAKKISYIAGRRSVINQGNIYAFQNYIFQIDPGFGIHVIDNTTPSLSDRIGFITVRGCSQISIKNNKIFTNSYDDLVVLDITDLNNLHEESRLRGVFTEYRYQSPLAQPPAAGYYECPRHDSLVVGWKTDSVLPYCRKY